MDKELEKYLAAAVAQGDDEDEIRHLYWDRQAVIREVEELRTKLEKVRGALREALSTFAHPTHPGRECRQSGHVPIETLRRWQAILDS